MAICGKCGEPIQQKYLVKDFVDEEKLQILHPECYVEWLEEGKKESE